MAVKRLSDNSITLERRTHPSLCAVPFFICKMAAGAHGRGAF